MQYRNFFTAPAANASGESSSTASYGYYKRGVKNKYPKKNQTLRVQILPAYDPKYAADPQSYVPCLVNGQPSQWFGMIQAAKFIGHMASRDDWKSTGSILSLASFEGREPCPYLRVLGYCKNNPDWKYLVEKTGRYGAPDFVDAPLKPAKSILLMNIVDVDNPGGGVVIGEFSFSIAKGLLDPESGIVFRRNNSIDDFPNAAEFIAQNPMCAYANGDITDPARAPVFVVELPPIKPGQFGAGYTIRIESSQAGVTRRPASDVEMSSRYHLEDPESYLEIPTGQDIVDTLVRLLKGHKNMRGIDETCMIAEAVGSDYRIDTVSAPGAVNTVQGWSAPQPAAQPFRPQPAAPAAPAAAAPVAPVAAPQIQSPYQPSGFAPSPAPVPQQPSPAMAIPGEPDFDDEAAAIAARLKSQMAMRG